MPLEAKHTRLGKFSDAEDVNFQRVLYCLSSLARNAEFGSLPNKINAAQSITVPETAQDPPPERSQLKDAALGLGSGDSRNSIQDISSLIALNNESKISAGGHVPEVKQISSFPTTPRVSSTDIRDPALQQIDGHSPSFNAGEATAASPPSISVPSSKDLKSHTEPVLSTARNIHHSTEAQPSQPEFPAPRSLAPREPRFKTPEPLLKLESKAPGWSVTEKEGLASAIAIGVGAGASSVSAIAGSVSARTTRQNLDVTRETLDRSTESATAGTRSAKYAKKGYRLQRRLAMNNPKDDSGYVSDSSSSSNSSKGPEPQSNRTGQVQPQSKKQRTFLNLKKLVALPRVPNNEPSQPFHSQSGAERGRDTDQEGPPQAIAYQTNGDALAIDANEVDDQNTASKNGKGGAADGPKYDRQDETITPREAGLDVREDQDEGQ